MATLFDCKGKAGKLFFGLFGAGVAQTASADNSTVKLPNAGGAEIYTIATQKMQDFVDFLGGPGMLAVIFVSLVIILSLWSVNPKSAGLLGWLCRTIAAAIILFNIATVLVYLKGN
ncbi:hypothetical protein N4Z11_003634 [Salmonella enterica]|uniref:Uncharacterized protein n=1 Tax=Salmonella enterica TaxID=28901 RepID=A0A624WE27_SALER|nr:hypothetical protein [Salmonella enterica]EBQ7118538.1 hypothetical protein [Salmonella enterica]EBQ7940023.1 hypothetical protein [Salmonella enterica]ECL8622620.1 hypothetical protein [Salmonella enterica]ECP5714613.1 hypothetical protein [Salmonella enterica]